jgi:hypothetical protein
MCCLRPDGIQYARSVRSFETLLGRGNRVRVGLLAVVLAAGGCSSEDGVSAPNDESTSAEAITTTSTVVAATTITAPPTVPDTTDRCAVASEALINITDRSVAGDPTANTVVGGGLTTIEVALAEAAAACGPSQIGWALGEWIGWMGAEVAVRGDDADGLADILEGVCAALDSLPPVPESASTICTK